jgi:hypothetical protein
MIWQVLDFYDGILVATSVAPPRHAIFMLGVGRYGDRIYARFGATQIAAESFGSLDDGMAALAEALDAAPLVEIGVLRAGAFVASESVPTAEVRRMFPPIPEVCLFRRLNYDIVSE